MNSRAKHTLHPVAEWLLWLVWICARPPATVITWSVQRTQRRAHVQVDVLAHWQIVAVAGLVLLIVQTINLGFVLR